MVVTRNRGLISWGSTNVDGKKKSKNQISNSLPHLQNPKVVAMSVNMTNILSIHYRFSIINKEI